MDRLGTLHRHLAAASSRPSARALPHTLATDTADGTPRLRPLPGTVQTLGKRIPSPSTSFTAAPSSPPPPPPPAPRLVVKWTGYHHMSCFWSDSRARPCDRMLFLGFTDGAANLMLVADPTGGRRRLLLQLQDPGSPAGSSKSRVFAERTPVPRPALLAAALRDLGGWTAARARAAGGSVEGHGVNDDGAGQLYLRCGHVFERGWLPGSAALDPADAEYLQSLRITVDVRLDGRRGGGGGPQVIRGAKAVVCTMPPPPPAATPLTERYRALATEPAYVAAFGAAVAATAAELGRQNGGAVAVGSDDDGHATAWLSAVLLLAVGVSEHDVAADYLRGRGGTTASPRQPGLLQAGLAAAKAAAAGGSIEAYLGSVLGLADHDRDTLRQTLVAPP